MESEVWGPSAWTFLHTVTLNYPEEPTNEDIKQQLGIKFYDYNVQTWRDKENEKSMSHVNEYLDEIEKLKKEGNYDPKAIKNYDER